MKWQSITYEEFENPPICGEITIRNYKWLRRFGARLHNDPVRACWTFRLAYFHYYHCPRLYEIGRGFSIPIPFMKNDHGVRIW